MNNGSPWNSLWHYQLWSTLAASKNAQYWYYHAKEALRNGLQDDHRHHGYRGGQLVMARKPVAVPPAAARVSPSPLLPQLPGPAQSIPATVRDVDENAYFVRLYGTATCPECFFPFSRQNNIEQPVQEGCCNHVKCRRCLISNQAGCIQCLQVKTTVGKSPNPVESGRILRSRTRTVTMGNGITNGYHQPTILPATYASITSQRPLKPVPSTISSTTCIGLGLGSTVGVTATPVPNGFHPMSPSPQLLTLNSSPRKRANGNVHQVVKRPRIQEQPETAGKSRGQRVKPSTKQSPSLVTLGTGSPASRLVGLGNQGLEIPVTITPPTDCTGSHPDLPLKKRHSSTLLSDNVSPSSSPEHPLDPDDSQGTVETVDVKGIGDECDEEDVPVTPEGGDGRAKKKRNPVTIYDHITILSGDPLLYQCSICMKKFKTKAHIKYHEFCQNGHKPFKCEECGQGFIAKSHFEYHIRTHTGERPYTCPKCGKGFNQRGKVTRHMRSHTGEKPFVCPTCGRGFANTQAMRSHLLIHTGERPFACEYCDKRFTGMTNLKKHVITHTGERPFMCTHCGKSFGLKWTLDLHLRTHSSERPFACQQCSRAFSNSKDLRRHMVIHSGERPYKCWICGTAFRRKDNLDRHIKNTHHQPKDVAKKLANEAAAEYLATQQTNQKDKEKETAIVKVPSVDSVIMPPPPPKKKSPPYYSTTTVDTAGLSDEEVLPTLTLITADSDMEEGEVSDSDGLEMISEDESFFLKLEGRLPIVIKAEPVEPTSPSGLAVPFSMLEPFEEMEEAKPEVDDRVVSSPEQDLIPTDTVVPNESFDTAKSPTDTEADDKVEGDEIDSGEVETTDGTTSMEGDESPTQPEGGIRSNPECHEDDNETPVRPMVRDKVDDLSVVSDKAESPAATEDKVDSPVPIGYKADSPVPIGDKPESPDAIQYTDSDSISGDSLAALRLNYYAESSDSDSDSDSVSDDEPVSDPKGVSVSATILNKPLLQAAVVITGIPEDETDSEKKIRDNLNVTGQVDSTNRPSLSELLNAKLTEDEKLSGRLVSCTGIPDKDSSFIPPQFSDAYDMISDDEVTSILNIPKESLFGFPIFEDISSDSEGFSDGSDHEDREEEGGCFSNPKSVESVHNPCQNPDAQAVFPGPIVEMEPNTDIEPDTVEKDWDFIRDNVPVRPVSSDSTDGVTASLVPKENVADNQKVEGEPEIRVCTEEKSTVDRMSPPVIQNDLQVEHEGQHVLEGSKVTSLAQQLCDDDMYTTGIPRLVLIEPGHCVQSPGTVPADNVTNTSPDLESESNTSPDLGSESNMSPDPEPGQRGPPSVGSTTYSDSSVESPTVVTLFDHQDNPVDTEMDIKLFALPQFPGPVTIPEQPLMTEPTVPVKQEPVDYNHNDFGHTSPIPPPEESQEPKTSKKRTLHFLYSNPNDMSFTQPAPDVNDSNLRIVYVAAAAQAEDSDEETGTPSKIRLLYAEALGYGGNGVDPPQFVYTSATPNQCITSEDQSIFAIQPRFVTPPSDFNFTPDRVRAMFDLQPPTGTSTIPMQVITHASGSSFAQNFAEYPENHNIMSGAADLANLIPREQTAQRQEITQVFASHGFYQHPVSRKMSPVPVDIQVDNGTEENYHPNSVSNGLGLYDLSNEEHMKQLRAQSIIDAAKAVAAVGECARRQRERERFEYWRAQEELTKTDKTEEASSVGPLPSNACGQFKVPEGYHLGPRKHYLHRTNGRNGYNNT